MFHNINSIFCRVKLTFISIFGLSAHQILPKALCKPKTMKPTLRTLEELPNLTVVKKLANGDRDFQRKFLGMLKQEFAEHYLTYRFHMEMQEPRAASETIYKLKPILAYLALDAGCEMADKHQFQLQTGESGLHRQFEKMLYLVRDFLAQC